MGFYGQYGNSIGRKLLIYKLCLEKGDTNHTEIKGMWDIEGVGGGGGRWDSVMGEWRGLKVRFLVLEYNTVDFCWLLPGAY